MLVEKDTKTDLVLIVEPDETLREQIKEAMEMENFTVRYGDSLADIIHLIQKEEYSLIISEMELKDANAGDICRQVNELSSAILCILSAEQNEIDIVLTMELGADEFMVKPFSIRELVARCKAHMRRLKSKELKKKEALQILKEGIFELNLARYELKKDQQYIELTQREFELFKYLIQHANHVFSREELLKQVWDFDFPGDIRTVDVTIRRIREKIEEDASHPEYIITKRGLGYLFCHKEIVES